MTTDRCVCRFNGVCNPRRQHIQRSWLLHGMTPEQVFGAQCVWWGANVEAEYYDVPPREPREAA